MPPHSVQLDRRGPRTSRRRGAGRTRAGRTRAGRGRGGQSRGGRGGETQSEARAGETRGQDKGDQGQDTPEAKIDGDEAHNQEKVTERAVKVDRLEKTLGANKVLRGISLEAHPGEIFGLLGPNGAGKTTTLRIICTMLAPDAGSVEVLGFDTQVAPEEVRRRVGVVTAEIGVYPRLSARENIAYFAELSGVLDGELDRKVDITTWKTLSFPWSRQRRELDRRRLPQGDAGDPARPPHADRNRARRAHDSRRAVRHLPGVDAYGRPDLHDRLHR